MSEATKILFDYLETCPPVRDPLAGQEEHFERASRHFTRKGIREPHVVAAMALYAGSPFSNCLTGTEKDQLYKLAERMRDSISAEAPRPMRRIVGILQNQGLM